MAMQIPCQYCQVYTNLSLYDNSIKFKNKVPQNMKLEIYVHKNTLVHLGKFYISKQGEWCP